MKNKLIALAISSVVTVCAVTPLFSSASWGYPYVYQRYDPYNYLRWHTYVIYSVGPNGGDEHGNGDDIGNW